MASPPLSAAVSIPSPGGDALELTTLQPKGTPCERLDLSLLDGAERRRAASLRRGEDRLSYVGAHVLLRQLLGERLGMPPPQIPLIRQPCPVCGNSTGRPTVDLPGPPLHFSLSRSAGLVLIGIAPTPVGVDVEALPDPRTVSTVPALLHPRECQELAAAAPAERPALFARLWTRKEALLKARGVGIAHGLDADYIGSQPQAVSPAGWAIFDLDLPGGFTAAAAIAAGRAACSARHPEHSRDRGHLATQRAGTRADRRSDGVRHRHHHGALRRGGCKDRWPACCPGSNRDAQGGTEPT